MPRRCIYYGVAATAHSLFTLIFPFFSVPLIVGLMNRDLYRLTIASLAAPFFSVLAYFSMKRWPVIKKDRRLILILVAAIISYITVYETVPDMGEKLHVLNFSVLAILIYKTFSPLMKVHGALLLSWAIAGTIGGVDEWLQNFIPGRAATLHDVLIAVRSGILGGIFGWIFDAYSRKGRNRF